MSTPRLTPQPGRLVWFYFVAWLALASLLAQGKESAVPAGSAIAKAQPPMVRRVLNPLEEGGVLELETVRMKAPTAWAYPNLEPKAGFVALKLEGDAEGAGGGGNYVLCKEPTGELRHLGVWVYLHARSNVRDVGLEVVDGEGESLLALVEAQWEGWKWLEFKTDGAEFRPAAGAAAPGAPTVPAAPAQPATGKNGRIDFPLKRISLAWRAKEAGLTSLGADTLVASGPAPEGARAYGMQVVCPPGGEPGRPLQALLTVNNLTDQPLELAVSFSIQRNPAMDEQTVQDALPSVGPKVEEKDIKVKVAPGDFSLLALPTTVALPTDSYRLGVKAQGPAEAQFRVADCFIMPDRPVKLRPESRFGMNVSSPVYIPLLQRLGVGWVRYENLKWRIFNPGPGEFRFTGDVEPFKVDQYIGQYRAAGFSVLPYVFNTPEWATSAPPEAKKNRGAYPPKDHATYGEAIHELVARYGSVKHPESKVKAKDHRSGLGLMHSYEIWNEPNLSAPEWGYFAGPLNAYLDLFRVGAEGAKRADPKVQVTTAGFAGLSMDWIDKLRTHTYPDGKRPIDFADVLNVHFYSGRQEPELATTDPNAFRAGAKPQENTALRDGVNIEDLQTYEKDLIAIADWRDRYKPAMPVWLTETGYDVGGPIGRSERHQAAKLPRCLMMAMANGVEKVFVYREKGSSPVLHGGAGMLRNNGTLRPAYFTLATLIRQLDGVTQTRVPRLRTDNPRLWMYRWKSGDKSLVTLWTTDGSEEPLGLDLGRCRVVNAFGGVSEMELGKDFKVGMFPLYITELGNPAPIDALAREAGAREQQRRNHLQRLSNARAYLFDFGSRDRLGNRTIGHPRQFEGVLGEDVYNKEKGFGFLAPAGKSEVRPYIASALERDAVWMRPNDVFRIDAAPGLYDLEFKGEVTADEVSLSVRGGKEGALTLPLAKGKGLATARLTVTAGQPLEFQLASKGKWIKAQWLALVEVVDPKP